MRGNRRRTERRQSCRMRQGGEAVEIRSFREQEVGEDLIELARSAGRYSRFRVDARIDPKVFHAIYDAWLIRSVRREIADEVFVGSVAANDVGLVTVSATPAGATIGLLSVSDSARGRGIGRAMTEHAFEWAAERGCRTLRVATQACQRGGMRAVRGRWLFGRESGTHIPHLARLRLVSGLSADQRPGSWRTSLAPAALLLVTAVLYVWMAPRGFEFTDESYYFLNYLYWRDLTATVSFFGAYFELPFRLIGQSISGIRILTLAALVIASGFFTRQVCLYSRRSGQSDAGPQLSFILVGIAASFFYFGYFVSVRAPSYNLLALCTMLVATGLLPGLTTRGGSRGRFRMTALTYGLALGACGLSKAPTAVLMLGLHAMFFAVANRDWRLGRLVELTALILAGVALNLGLLQLADPSWLSALREGVAMTNIVGHGGLLELLRGMMREIGALLPALCELSLFAVLIIVLGRNIHHNRRTQISIAVVALISACTLELALSQDRYLWLPSVVLSALVLWSFETPWRTPPKWTRATMVSVTFTCLLFALPLAFSFGTNLAVFEHSEMAAIFGVVALLVALQRLADRRQITTVALAISLAVLCVPALVIQFQNAFDVRHAYRLRTALVNQTVPTRVGSANSSRARGHDDSERARLNGLGRARRGIPTSPARLGFDRRRPGTDLCDGRAATRRGVAIGRLFGKRGRGESADRSPSCARAPERVAAYFEDQPTTDPRLAAHVGHAFGCRGARVGRYRSNALGLQSGMLLRPNLRASTSGGLAPLEERRPFDDLAGEKLVRR